MSSTPPRHLVVFIAGLLLEDIATATTYLRTCAKVAFEYTPWPDATKLFDLCDTIQRAIQAYWDQGGQ